MIPWKNHDFFLFFQNVRGKAAVALGRLADVSLEVVNSLLYAASQDTDEVSLCVVCVWVKTEYFCIK